MDVFNDVMDIFCPQDPWLKHMYTVRNAKVIAQSPEYNIDSVLE